MLTELSAVNSCVSRAWATSPGPGTDPVEEFVERRSGIVRTGRGLRMILNGKDRFLAMTQSFDRPVVEIHVRDFELWCTGNFFFTSFDREAVILRRDQHSSRRDFFHWMISAAMAVRHFHRACAVRESQDLMPQADTKNWYAAIGNRAHSTGRVIDGSGITWPIREEHAARLECKRFVRRRLRRNDRDSTIVLGEQAQNVSLDAEVVRDDVMRRLRTSPRVALSCRHAGCEVEPFHRGTRVERGERLSVGLSSSGHDTAHDADRS
jgi:hypothetical protein